MIITGIWTIVKKQGLVKMNKKYDNTEHIKDVYRNISPVISELEKDVCIESLFGRVAGSVTQGLNSKASDNDFLVFVTKKDGYTGLSYDDSEMQSRGVKEERQDPYEGHIYYTRELDQCQIEYEMGYIVFEEALKRINDHKNVLKTGYPSCFYRSKEEKERCNNLHPQLRKRDEYPDMMILLLLMDDYMWVKSGDVDPEIVSLYKTEKIIDILDTYYVRAYGNYEHFIKDKESVPVRKYLYTMDHLTKMKWLIEKGTKSPVNFIKTMNGITIPQDVKESVEKYLLMNKDSEVYKTKYYERSDEHLNTYIGDSLEQIRSDMQNYSKDITLFDLVISMPEEQRAVVFDDSIGDFRYLRI